jgi:putative copper resistance protein D
VSLFPLLSLYAHLVFAVIFVGGSLFMWIALLPALKDSPEDVRNQVIVRVAKRFGKIVDISLVILVVTGVYNATWYLKGLGFGIFAKILLLKSVLVLVMIFSIYFNNVYLGRRISRLVRLMQTNQSEREQLSPKLSSIRRVSRAFSYLNIALMLCVLLLAVMLQIPP